VLCSQLNMNFWRRYCRWSRVTIVENRQHIAIAIAISSILISSPLEAQADPWSVDLGAAHLTGDASGKPATIPALRTWTAASGSYYLPSSVRIVIQPSESSILRDTADIFAGELSVETGVHAEVEVDAVTQPGDIALRLKASDDLRRPEGYELEVSDRVFVRGICDAGVFYGTRSLLQIFHRSRRLSNGLAEDWPDFKERGVMLDIARKFFPEPDLEKVIHLLAYYKMNYLHLHLSDDNAVRIKLPGLLMDRSAQYLKDFEVKALLREAAKYHVLVVPEVDLPGHMGGILEDGGVPRDYRMRTRFGFRSRSVIDFSNDAAVQFARILVGGLLKQFPSTYLHTGGDEVFGLTWLYKLSDTGASRGPARALSYQAKDALHLFQNSLSAIICAHGETMRVWNDELMDEGDVSVDPSVVVDWWTDRSLLGDWHAATPDAVLSAGHQISNDSYWPTYWVSGFHLKPNPDIRQAYSQWSANQFSGWSWGSGMPSSAYEVSLENQDMLGVHFNIWNDLPNGKSTESIISSAKTRLRVISQKAWSAEPTGENYEAFARFGVSLGDTPETAAVH
jgi:hexosaminidase